MFHDILLYFIKKYNKNQFFRSGEPRFPLKPPPSQGTYGSPETPPLKGNNLMLTQGNQSSPLKPPPLIMLLILYLILIIRLTSICFLLREGFQGNRRFPEKEGGSGGTLVPLT